MGGRRGVMNYDPYIVGQPHDFGFCIISLYHLIDALMYGYNSLHPSRLPQTLNSTLLCTDIIHYTPLDYHKRSTQRSYVRVIIHYTLRHTANVYHYIV